MNQMSLQIIADLKSHYLAQIDEIINECEHVYRSTIDYNLLNTKIDQLLVQAKVDGLEEKVIWEILHRRIPSYVNYINYTKQKYPGKKAA